MFNGRTPLDKLDRTLQIENVSGTTLQFFRYGEGMLGSTALPSVTLTPGDIMTAPTIEQVFGRKDVALTWVTAFTPAASPGQEAALRVTYIDG